MRIPLSNAVLRPLEPADAESLARHANDREIWLNLRDRFPHPYGVADARAYIAAVGASSQPRSFGIIVEGEAAGSISLMPGDDIARRSAELGYWLGRPYWGRGIVSEAVGAVTAHAFSALGLARVFAVPFVRNPASRRVLEKNRYVVEGRLRASAVKDGQLLDQWLLAAYAEEAPGAMIPNARLAPFAPFIGEWTTVGQHAMIPGVTLRGRTVFDWHEGGAFLRMRSEIDDARIPTGIALVGSDDASGGFGMLYFDERGVSRRFDVAVDGTVARWWRTAPGFSQRFTLSVVSDGDTLRGVSELSKDDTTWEQDLTLTYTRVR